MWLVSRYAFPTLFVAWDSCRHAILVLVHSNLFISLASTSIALVTILLLGLPVEFIPLFIVFAATLFVYNLNRFTDRAEDSRNTPARAAFLNDFGYSWFVLGLVLYVAAVCIAVWLSLPGAHYLVLPIIVGVGYSVFRLKRVFLLKNLLVGASWGLIPLGVAFYYGVLWSHAVVFLAGFVTVMLTTAAAVFDIKDISGDRALGIQTLPIVLNSFWTRILAAITTLIVASVTVIFASVGIIPGSYLVLLALPVYVLGYLPFATPDRGPLFYGFVIDGEHLVLALTVTVYTILG